MDFEQNSPVRPPLGRKAPNRIDLDAESDQLTMTVKPLNDDRRSNARSAGDNLSPECLLANQIDAARDQLGDARERLKGARRKVVQMEEALANWEHIACELLARRETEGYRVAS